MEPNSEIHVLDKNEFESELKTDLRDKKILNIFCSFTYITPNYSILFTLNELKKFVQSNLNFRVFIIFWDMNTLANPYFKRLYSTRKIENQSVFIDQKITELKDIALSIGFDKEHLSIYKSSNLWRRLTSYKEENIFQHFYSILAQMKINDFVENNKVSHLVQIPMDMFFCNYFHKLYPEDVDRPIDLVFFGQDKENLYTAARALMLKDGLIEHKKPLFVLMRNFPYLIHNYNVPTWDMALKDIRNIIINCSITKKEIFSIFRNIASTSGTLQLKSQEKIEKISYDDFSDDYNGKPQKELQELMALNLFDYLKAHRKKYMEISGKIEESVLNINDKKDVHDIGQVLKSNIALEIMLLSDGTRNTTEISKMLEKSVATISTYANRLKKMKLIRLLPNGNLKRNIKGVKINFELGL